MRACEETYFEELAHVLTEAGRVGWHLLAGDPGRRQAVRWQNSFLFQADVSFVLLRPLTDGIRATYIMEGNLQYSKSTHENVNII